jgi:CMP-N-acetylneuraminic acid synthetase
MILKNKSVLGIIPARLGSKRIFRKNLKIFNKKPLFYWTVNEAKNSNLIDKTLVTSDSNLILEKAKEYKINFCIKRPKSLANSSVDSWSVVRHAINNLKKKKLTFDYVVLLQPTSPLRKSYHINQCLRQLQPNDTGIVSINKNFKPIEWQKNLYKKKNFSLFKSGIVKYKKNKRVNSTYIINGAIYAFKTKEIFKKNFLFKKTVKTYNMNPQHSIDIDTILEFRIAEFLKNFFIK